MHMEIVRTKVYLFIDSDPYNEGRTVKRPDANICHVHCLNA